MHWPGWLVVVVVAAVEICSPGLILSRLRAEEVTASNVSHSRPARPEFRTEQRAAGATVRKHHQHPLSLISLTTPPTINTSHYHIR